VRIGDEFRNQLVETGHWTRMSDLDAMASSASRRPLSDRLGNVAPQVPTELDFSWHDKRLERLRELGIEVIGGLVHHGSGPRYTSMLDPHSRPCWRICGARSPSAIRGSKPGRRSTSR
jgi:dTDP-4-dehydrorhamnose reductase